jgi:pimeloyl-ACP methyl ester carboxylesterase
MRVERFSLPYSQEAVDDLNARLRRTRWIDEIPNSNWEYGFDRALLQDICEYWASQFDWKSQLHGLSGFPHYLYAAESGRIHFIHARGKGPAPIPLILTHGWPGSFLELLRILPLLTDPADNGGDTADSFDVVIPSLPGFGFSDRPVERGMNAFRIADLWAALMRELGYERFGAQGGDLGAGVSTALGLRYSDRIIGIHLNFIPGSFRPFLAPHVTLEADEKAFVDGVGRWAEKNGAYSHLQRTRPQTAAYGLNDSPAALAAWIIEKFRDWSDCDGDVFRRFSRDELLTNVTLYWMTETIHSSFRLYFENGSAPLQFEPRDFVRPPCAFARFPKEISAPPRAWVERGYNVRRWCDMPRGGHFAAAEEPGLLAQDLRSFFREFRG